MSTLEIKDLHVTVEGKEILKGVNLTMKTGEIHAIMGPNGTGKSTFIKILMGQVKPDSGTVDVGETVRFGYYSQDGLQFDEQMKVIDVVQDIAEVIELGNGKKLTASQFLQHFLFTPETQHSYVYKLSGGERRRLYLCTVLMRNPNFLVLDEPTAMLDPQGRQEVMETVQRLHREQGITVILITHFMEEAEYCDRFMIQDHGQLLVLGSPQSVREQMSMPCEDMNEIFLAIVGNYRAQEG